MLPQPDRLGADTRPFCLNPSTAELTAEQLRWQDAGRRYADEVVRPVAIAWDAIPRPEDVPSIELIRQASRYGLRTMNVPAAMGGGGADALSHCLVHEEVAAADLGTAIMLSQVMRWTPVVTRAMTDEQRGRYLPEFLSNETFFIAGAQTEAAAGSDNQGMFADPQVGIQGSAVRDGAGWLLNGRKHFINGGGCASLYAILLRTDRRAPSYEGCTYFLVRPDTPGFRVVRLHDKLAGRLGALAELELVDCRVGDAERLGEVNRGFQTPVLDLLARLMDASQALGVGREALRLGVVRATESVGGRRSFDEQGVRVLLAESAVEVEAARCLLWQAARCHDRGDDITGLVAAAKHFAAESGLRAVRRTFDVYGADGSRADSPAGKLVRDSMTFMHFGGTQQMVLLRVAEQLEKVTSDGETQRRGGTGTE